MLSDHFSPPPSEVLQRFRFNGRVRQPGESVSTFVAEIRKLSEHCNFGDALDKTMRDCIIGGINDEAIREKLLAEKGDLTYKRTVEIKSVNMLTAIRWVALAWSKVAADTICKCFRKAGILDTDLDVISRDADDNDPFLEADNLQELSRLIEKTGDDGCSSSEFVSGDDDLPVCVEMDDDNWPVFFTNDVDEEEEEEDSDNDDGSDPEQVVSLHIKSYKDAIVALEDVILFLQQKGNLEEAVSLGSTIDAICKSKNALMVQTTLDNYFVQK